MFRKSNLVSIVERFLGIDREGVYAFLEFNSMQVNSNKSPFYVKEILLLFSPILLVPLLWFRNRKYFIRTNNSISKNIFLSTFTHNIHFKAIETIMDDDPYSIMYLPVLNTRYVKKHMNSYIQKNNVGIVRFSFNFLDYYINLFRNLPGLIGLLSLQIKDTRKSGLLKEIFLSLLYKNILISSFKKISKYNNFFFNYDKTSTFIGFIDLLKRRNINNIHIQHGTFFEPNSFYLPAYCDYVFACSEREKKLFIKHGARLENIFVIGAPLQIYNHELEVKKRDVIYDICVLLANFNSSDPYDEQKELILYLSEITESKKILLRFRPSSREEDLKTIDSEILKRFHISDSTLVDDIYQSNFIFSFSFDSVHTLLKLRKNFFLVLKPALANQISDSDLCKVVHDISNINFSDLNSEFESIRNTYNSDYDFGSHSIAVLRKNFHKALGILSHC